VSVQTLEDLINWTQQLHGHLATCLADCARRQGDQRASALLDYLAGHERKLESLVAGFKQKAGTKALRASFYDPHSRRPIDASHICDGHFAELQYEQIWREVIDFHGQIIDRYRALLRSAGGTEARELLESLLERQEREAMRLSRQVGRMADL